MYSLGRSSDTAVAMSTLTTNNIFPKYNSLKNELSFLGELINSNPGQGKYKVNLKNLWYQKISGHMKKYMHPRVIKVQNWNNLSKK